MKQVFLCLLLLLAARETRLANDLELERARLNDLNDRLNALELELTPGKP